MNKHSVGLSATLADIQATRQALRLAASEKLRAEFPYLVTDGDSLVRAAKNIRVQLKRSFPGVRFSVRTRRFSMGDSIDVHWIDGPCSGQVDKIINAYRAGSFDGMTDSYTYEPCAWTVAFGDAKYVSSRRDYSDALVARVMDRLIRQYGGCEPRTVEDFRMGRLWNWRNSGGCDMHRALMLALSKHTLCITRRDED